MLDLDPATYQPHALHATDRVWTETNCYVDLWIEVLHALGLDPIAACAFTLSTDFEGDQWTFFKYPPEDLRALYGIEVSEMNVWRPVLDHVEEHLDFGRLLTVEVDAWHLPDTAGVSYGTAHVKTTIVPTHLDRSARRLDYFHNAGLFTLDADDFDGVFARQVLPPYVELVRLRKRLEDDLPWLAAAGLDGFHAYAFGTCRQAGATAELAGDLCDWLTARGCDVGDAGEHLRAVATSAKSAQLMLARAARGRVVDLASPLGQMETDWDAAITALVERHAA